MKSLNKAVLAAAVSASALCGSAGAQHDMSQMGKQPMPSLPLGIPLTRLGSGTSWIPDAAPMYAAHRSAGDWTLMLHGAAFGQYDRQYGFRGDTQFGLIDWEMLMAMRPLAGGLFRLNLMTSLQPFVIGPRGYPELVQTGGTDNGLRLVNRQHPHDLFGELAAIYDHSITSSLAMSVYVAPAGEPAIGPVAYMHRPSGEDDPFAPIGHHWQDATHETQGVVTLGVYGKAVKLEGSMFNGREPDNYRFNLDAQGAKLDSYSGRLTVAPNSNVALSAWGGYIFAHDRLDIPTGMQRYGASVLTTSAAWGGRTWSNGVVWGLNIHHHGGRAHNHGTEANPQTYHLSAAALIESSLAVTKQLSVYGRLEQAQKTADDLGFLGGEPMQTFNVRTISLGATHDLHAFGSAAVGLGARGSVNLLPETLRLTYQTRTPAGFAVYLRVRPR